MKRLFLAAMAAVALTAGAASAAPVYPKQVPLVWGRTNGSSFTWAGRSDGNHPPAGLGINVSPQDTSQAIDIRDHAAVLRRTLAAGANGGVAGALVQDTLAVFGTVSFVSSKNSIDSLTIFRDFSSDGKVWVAVDSIGGHVIADTAWVKQSAVSDSIQAFLGVPAQSPVAPDFIARRCVTYSWNYNPWFGTNVVTSQAGLGFNFIRFRIHMTGGDFAAAGAVDGYDGIFSYPAMEPNFNK